MIERTKEAENVKGTLEIKINLWDFLPETIDRTTRESHKFVNGDIEEVIVASKILIKIALPRRYISIGHVVLPYGIYP